MKILLTGHNGMVGTDLKKRFVGKELITPDKYELNIGNYEQVMSFKKHKPKIIIHLAAETDHEFCDLNPSQCYFINTIGTSNMMELAKSCKAKMFYVSAGSIFDGKKGLPYKTLDTPNPINHYNRSKYYGELILKSYKQHYIIRCGWMFGGGPGKDKKFVNKIIKKINSGQKNIKVCDDCIGSPTYSKDVATTIYEIAMREFSPGVYHVTNNCGNGVSRYEYAKEIVKVLRKKVNIVRCKIDDLKDEFPCKRTNYEVLENSLSYFTRDWKKALREYINDYFRH